MVMRSPRPLDPDVEGPVRVRSELLERRSLLCDVHFPVGSSFAEFVASRQPGGSSSTPKVAVQPVIGTKRVLYVRVQFPVDPALPNEVGRVQTFAEAEDIAAQI